MKPLFFEAKLNFRSKKMIFDGKINLFVIFMYFFLSNTFDEICGVSRATFAIKMRKTTLNCNV